MRKMTTRLGVVASVLATTVAFTAAQANASGIGYDPSCDAQQIGGKMCYER